MRDFREGLSMLPLGFDDAGLQGGNGMGRGYGEPVNSAQRVII